MQAKYEQVNISCKNNSKYTTQVCKNTDFDHLVHVLFCQIGDDMHFLTGEPNFHLCTCIRAALNVGQEKLTLGTKQLEDENRVVLKRHSVACTGCNCVALQKVDISRLTTVAILNEKNTEKTSVNFCNAACEIS